VRAQIMVASLAFLIVRDAMGTVVDTGTDAQRYCQRLVEGSFYHISEAQFAGACGG
jgi:hypothetical protein